MKGAAQMIATLKKVASKFPDRVAQGMFIEGQVEMTESKRRCPVDTRPNAPHPGQLRASGRVHRPERGRGRWITVTLSYGTDYAVFVHENPDAFHPVGQWKYLESVLNESQPHMAARLARRIDLDNWRV